MARSRTFPLGLLPPLLIGKHRLGDPASTSGRRPVEERVARPMRNLVAPSVSGTTEVGEVLTASIGSWSGDLPHTFALQWVRDNADVDGATSDTYLLSMEDFGGRLQIRVTASNGLGSVVVLSAESDEVGPGSGVAPTITVAPVLTWTVAHGSSPTITPPTYTGDPATITYDLIRLPSTTVLSGVDLATAQAYVADRDTDLGPDWELDATVTNGSGSDSATSNTVTWDRSSLPIAGGHSGAGLVLADSGTTVDAWASSFGSVSATLTAPTASQRFAYSATAGVGSRPAATSDGVDDVLSGTITKGSGWTDFEIGFVGIQLGAETAADRFIEYEGAAALIRLESRGATGGARLITGGTGGATSIATSLVTTTTAHWSGDGDGANQNVRYNGTAEDTDASTATYVDGGTLCVGARASGSNPVNVRYQAWYGGDQLTSDQRLDLRALLTYLTGVSS